MSLRPLQLTSSNAIAACRISQKGNRAWQLLRQRSSASSLWSQMAIPANQSPRNCLFTIAQSKVTATTSAKSSPFTAPMRCSSSLCNTSLNCRSAGDRGSSTLQTIVRGCMWRHRESVWYHVVKLCAAPISLPGITPIDCQHNEKSDPPEAANRGRQYFCAPAN